jgi:hypothetical protein
MKSNAVDNFLSVCSQHAFDGIYPTEISLAGQGIVANHRVDEPYS